jgi:hypothetical protein
LRQSLSQKQGDAWKKKTNTEVGEVKTQGKKIAFIIPKTEETLLCSPNKFFENHMLLINKQSQQTFLAR